MRVVEVWRQRQIFDLPVLDAIEKGIRDVDQSRGGGKKATLGGSLFASSANGALPPLLVPLGKHAGAIEKAELTGKNTIITAQSEYVKMTDPEAAVPTPPVYAARLSGLLKNLANAESAVSECVRARTSLITELEQLLQKQRAALEVEEPQLQDLTSKKLAIEAKKREVEDGIMRGLSAESTPGSFDDPPRPEVERFTPPPMQPETVESITPPGSPPKFEPEPAGTNGTIAPAMAEIPQLPIQPYFPFLADSPTTETLPPITAPLDDPADPSLAFTPLPGLSSDPRLSASMSTPTDPRIARRQASSEPSSDPRKRQKTKRESMNEDAVFANGGVMEGIDDDVQAMLGAE